MQYWVDRKVVNPGVWIAIVLVIIICINYFGVRFFGEFEFWLSSFKVVTIVGVIILSLVLALGGGPDHDRKGFRYWQDPGYVFLSELLIVCIHFTYALPVHLLLTSGRTALESSSASGQPWLRLRLLFWALSWLV
jgi:amino acid permease